MSSVEKQILGDPKLSASLKRFSESQSSVVELPMRLEPSNSYLKYHSEDVELSPTALISLNEKVEQNRKNSPYILSLGKVPLIECYPFQYRNSEGTFQKKIHYFRYPESSVKPCVERAFFTFEPHDNYRKAPDKPYFRIIYQPENGRFNFFFGLKDGPNQLAGGDYDRNGKLTYIYCHTGTIPPNPGHNPVEGPAFYSGDYAIVANDIKVSKLFRHGGKARFGFEYKPFEKVVTSESLGGHDEKGEPISDGKAVRIKKKGNFLCIETGVVDKMNYPDFSATVPLKINVHSISGLLLSKDKGSLIELAKKTTVAFESELYGININTILHDYKFKSA